MHSCELPGLFFYSLWLCSNCPAHLIKMCLQNTTLRSERGQTAISSFGHYLKALLQCNLGARQIETKMAEYLPYSE